MDEFLKDYGSELRQKLQRNDKTTINMLSMLAEAQKNFAEGIVGVIEQHILTCPPPAKLPALYLVDSILKNVKEPYISLFGKRIAEVFGSVWDITLQDKRSSLSKLYVTWDRVFPPAVLAQVAARMVSPSNGRQPPAQVQQPGLPPVQQMQQQQPLIQLPVQYGAPAGSAVTVLAPPQQQPYLSAQQPYAGVQQPPLGLTYMQLANGQLVQVALPQPPLQQQVLMQRQTPTYQQYNTPGYQQHSTPGYQQHSTPGYQQHNTPTYQQHNTPTHQQHKTPQHVMQVQRSSVPPVSPGHGAYLQQQQQQYPQAAAAAGLGPMVRRSPNSPGQTGSDSARGPPPPPAGHNRRTASPGPKSGGDVAGDALSQLLSNLASRGVLAQKESEADLIKTTEFQPAFLKELHPGVLDELKQLSQRSAPRFRDVEFQRNKRKTATAGSAVSRSWYLPVDTWIAGTTAPEEILAANPFEDEFESDSEGEEAEAVEPEDPDQTTCAISGEPFDKFFDQDQEGWFYRGARRITGEEAERYGVPDGSLVKVKCLAEAGLGSGPAAMAAAGAAGDADQPNEALMAAAAAEAPAAGGADTAAAVGQQQEQQQHEGPVAADVKQPIVKQEALQDVDDSQAAVKAEGVGTASASGDVEHSGSKREGSADAAEEGTPAKRAKLEQ